jgi:hypothetical protein
MLERSSERRLMRERYEWVDIGEVVIDQELEYGKWANRFRRENRVRGK